jgi:hypothetical protein
MLLGFLVTLTVRAAEGQAEQGGTKVRPQLTNNVARTLRYFPEQGDFVITNGTEFFNRPLYCAHSAYRIDGGDRPEFSFYQPGHGGNLRLGLRTAVGAVWLDEARQIVSRYRGGSLVYEINDPAIGAGKLELAAVPTAGMRGLAVRAELRSSAVPVELVFAFGGADGRRGRRGGDIGCESEPVAEFFRFQAKSCHGNKVTITSNVFVLHGRPSPTAGVFPSGTQIQVADGAQWESAAGLFGSTNSKTEFPVAAGAIRLHEGKPVCFALVADDGVRLPVGAEKLEEVFSAAENYRQEIARQVEVSTPDPFINAAASAMNVAADAIWDQAQQAFMHGAVAWRVRLLGWRGPAAGDALGWHDRTAEHLAGYARNQNTKPVPESIPPADESSDLARNEAALHSNGDMTGTHYDMNLIAVDTFFRHLLWTGDTNYARALWPAIERHFGWERRLFRREFGAERLPLYEAYAAIWASDDLNYNGAGTAHASALNYFANEMAARTATALGKDASIYEREAALILGAMQQLLWLPERGMFGESKDWLGRQLVHPDPGLWTFYHVVDSGVATPSQAAGMARWVDANLAQLPIRGANVPEENLFILPTTRWLPYQWSLNNVVVAENAHAALGFWATGRPDEAFRLFKGTLLETMFCGLCPGNVGAMTSHDAARGESQRDFGDGIGAASRALVEGLFGIHPDALDGELMIAPGFPADWTNAAIRHPDLEFAFHRDGLVETFSVESKFSRPMSVRLQIAARRSEIASVTVNGQPAEYKWLRSNPEEPLVEISGAAASRWEIRVKWSGATVVTASQTNSPVEHNARAAGFDWKGKVSTGQKFEPVNLAAFFNDRVTQIFRNEYRSPRSPFCSLAVPKQGIGGWCEPSASFDVDDSGLRKVVAGSGGKIVLPDGIPFATPGEPESRNIIFTSQWDNYPREVSVPLSGKSPHAFLLMAGSTGPMQSRFDNGEVVVAYADGSTNRLALRNPTNWWPIEQDYFTDDFAFQVDEPAPPRVDLATGKIRIPDANGFKGRGGKVPGGAATVLELPLDGNKELKSITVRAIANEVVIGLMGVTLER